LRPHPVTTYNIAYSERALGHYTRSYKLFRRCLAEHTAATNGTLPDDLLALLRGYLPEVEARLAHAFVKTETPEATLSVDGRPLEIASKPGDARLVLLAGTLDDRGRATPPGPSFELLLDPGQHLFVLSMPGASDQVVSERFEPGATRELVLSAKGADMPAKPASRMTPVSEKPPESSSNRTWTYVAFGVGGAGLVTSGIFAILTLNEKSFLDSNGHCHDFDCNKAYQSEVDAVHRDATATSIALGVGVAGAAVGTLLLFTGGSKENVPAKASLSARSTTIEPWVGATMLGARGRF
jgi:hypothetical protein